VIGHAKGKDTSKDSTQAFEANNNSDDFKTLTPKMHETREAQ
jgi:hypothetical protein